MRRPGPSGTPARGARVAGALLVALLALAGCGREPRFVPASADSALATAQDPFAEQVRVLQQRWAGAGGGQEAARLSAELLLADLRARAVLDPLAPWEARARALLDSLGIGAECAGAPGALAVNFFSRSDPSAGSWPWLFWNDRGSIEAREVEGRGMRLIALAARGLAGAPGPAPGVGPAPGRPDAGRTGRGEPPEPPAIAGLFSRRGGGGPQPLAMVWLAVAGLEHTQTLGPDSLGGVGSGAFETVSDGGISLTTRTWRTTPRFDECPACPHVVHERRFRWEAEGFRRVEDRVVPSPYVAFVDLIHALAAGDQDAALRRVTRPGLVGEAQAAGWATARAPWRPAPGRAEREDEMVFYRGPSEAWKVGFDRGPDGWLVDTFAVVPRTID